MRRFSAVFVMLLVGTVACGCNQQTAQSPSRLAVAKRLFDQHQFRKSEEALSLFILTHDSDATTLCEAYYLRGLCRRNQDESGNAVAENDFAKAVGRSCHPTIKGLAHVGLGHISFEQGIIALNKAKYHYLTALRTLEDTAPKDAVLYRLGVTLQRLGYWSQANKHLQQCADNFSTSPFASQATRRMGAKAFRLQVGAFSSNTRATTKISELQKKGWRFDSTPQTLNGKTLYFVRCGRYSTYQIAIDQLEQLTKIASDAIVIASN